MLLCVFLLLGNTSHLFLFLFSSLEVVSVDEESLLFSSTDFCLVISVSVSSLASSLSARVILLIAFSRLG